MLQRTGPRWHPLGGTWFVRLPVPVVKKKNMDMITRIGLTYFLTYVLVGRTQLY